MTTLHIHPHAEFDRFPQLLDSLPREFGRDGILAIAERFVEAERADFHWDGRLAEMNLGAYESFDEEDQAFEAVAIIGYFRGRYYVANLRRRCRTARASDAPPAPFRQFRERRTGVSRGRWMTPPTASGAVS